MTPGSARQAVLLACDYHLRYSARLGRGLVEAGADTSLLTRDHDGEFGGEPGAALRFVTATLGPGVRLRAIPGRVRDLAGWKPIPRLRRELARPRGRVLHVQQSVGNDPRLLLAAGLGRHRFAVTIHDPVLHPGDSESRWSASSNRLLIRTAGLIFVHGEALREELIEIHRPTAPVVVVPHGIVVDESPPPPPRPSILFFGRISRYKGLDTLLDAMETVWGSLPQATLVLAGGGPIEPHPALADDRVEVRNDYLPEDEIPGLFARSSVVALPYRQASQSGVGSLAKAYSRPMVVTAVGGLPELVGDGSGLVVPPEDPGVLAAALLEVLLDPERATELGRRGAATATAESSFRLVAEKTLEAYARHLRPTP